MFKRANKITALLVAAASVMSIVPVMAADSTGSRLGTKDGTVQNAVAFKDGKYIYEGYKSDDDDQAIYYNEGDKDKLLEDVQDADLVGSYVDKYAYANDGSDQYLVDLTNGDVIDDQTPEDDADSAATKLKTKLKKTDRYGDISDISASDLGYTGDTSTGVLPGNKFGDSWYSYAVDAVDPDTDTQSNLVGSQLFGFTDATGKYIDASNTANVYAYSTLKGKMVKIEEFSNNIDDADDDSGLLATLLAQPVVLTQDKDYIYALVKVGITDTASTQTSGSTTGSAVDVIGGVTTSSATAISGSTAVTTTRTYIQKISKAQGDQKDDAYLPKTVASYEVSGKLEATNWKAEYDSGDSYDAYDAIKAATGVEAAALTQENVVTDKNKAIFSVVGDKLVVVDSRSDSGNVKATSILLKKDKVKYKDMTPDNYTTGDKVDVYLTEKDDSDDVDADSADTAYDFDVDGNPWVVADGKIYEFTNNEMTKVYTCDTSLNAISAYDENNLITWEQDGDIYTTVNEGTAVTAGEATAVTTPAAAVTVGWSQLADGTWSFYDATGTKVASNWANVGGVWYYLKADGIMATGWLNDNGTWYFLNASGAMKTGWLNDNGTWYYLNASGAMAANTTVDGYTLNASGAWVN